jgi:hypothetical protein
MTIRSSTLWSAYFVVYAVGVAGLMYLLRRPHIEWFAYWLPFAFPVVLCAIGGLAVHYQSGEPHVEIEEVSIVGNPIVRIRPEPPRPTFPITYTMLLTPYFMWIFPVYTGIPRIRLVFVLWWVACALFAVFVLPRLGAFNPSSRASA